METPEPATSRSARQFVLMGVQLQEALRTGVALDASLDAFCREAFARKDLAQSISFLLTLVQKDVGRLAEILKVRHLVAELSVGSQILSSLVAAQWDKQDQADKLAELADGILSAHLSGAKMAACGEFSAALAKTIAVLHPARARALLDMASPLMARNSESQSMLKEAWDWQKAGELLAGKDIEFRRFWHQTLRQQRGDWFWDTAEGRKALAGLDSGTEDLNVRGGLFRRAVPAWAWKPGEEPPPSGVSQQRVTPATLPVKPAAPPSLAEEGPRRAEKSSWLAVGGIALLAGVAVVAASQIDLAQLLSGSAPTGVAAAAPSQEPQAPSLQAPVAQRENPPALASTATPEPSSPVPAKQPEPMASTAASTLALLAAPSSTAPELVEKDPASQPVAPPLPGTSPSNAALAVEAGTPLAASAVPTPLAAPTKASTIEDAPPSPAPVAASARESSAPVQAASRTVVSAEAVLVSLTSRQGWVKTPLGTEFKVTTANASAGKVTDAEGHVWRLPPDPKSVALVTSERQVTNPYSGEQVSVPSEQWKPGQELPFGTTGWTFALPPVLPAAQNTGAASTLALLASTPTPADAAPAGIEPTAGNALDQEAPSSAEAKKSATATTSTAKTKTKASPPKGAGKMVTARHPAGEAQRKEASSPLNGKTQQQLVFVTRANSIRMNYKGGYWESRPGAYLAGEGNTPAEWARDMTLRERSSGTIPDGYIFKVLDHGVVRVQPEPPGK